MQNIHGMALLTVLMALLLISLVMTAMLQSSLLAAKVAYSGQQQLIVTQQVLLQHQQAVSGLLQGMVYDERYLQFSHSRNVACPAADATRQQDEQQCELWVATTEIYSADKRFRSAYSSLLLKLDIAGFPLWQRVAIFADEAGAH
ncbi:hypothetical protein QE250_09530 [Chromatiaceae bacterium AAb-1]|nr:hypothetical protein [Chromatiaceae bacterium AAb-1]